MIQALITLQENAAMLPPPFVISPSMETKTQKIEADEESVHDLGFPKRGRRPKMIYFILFYYFLIKKK